MWPQIQLGVTRQRHHVSWQIYLVVTWQLDRRGLTRDSVKKAIDSIFRYIEDTYIVRDSRCIIYLFRIITSTHNWATGHLPVRVSRQYRRRAALLFKLLTTLLMLCVLIFIILNFLASLENRTNYVNLNPFLYIKKSQIPYPQSPGEKNRVQSNSTFISSFFPSSIPNYKIPLNLKFCSVQICCLLVH